jgi:hypothetical protein
MPYHKKPYKKRKTTKHETKTKNKNKNKNIIKINVSNQSGGGGGSSTIPIPYPISSQMFPTTQPVNIYNTMSRNPFQTEYIEPEKASNLVKEDIKVSQPEPVKQPAKQEEEEKFKNINTPNKLDFSKGPQLAIGLVDELRKKQEKIALKKLTQPTPNLDDLYKKDKPLPIGEGILSPIGKYEYNPHSSITEAQVREQLKKQGNSNQSIGQLIRHMKLRGELPY